MSTLDPVIAAELEDLERALAGEDNEWADLVRDVRADRPEMDPGFGQILDAKRAEWGRPKPAKRSGWLFGPAVLVGCGVVVAVVIGLSGNGSSNKDSSAVRLMSRPSSSEDASGGSSAASSAAPNSEFTAKSAPVPHLLRRRLVERHTRIVLSTDPKHVRSTADHVIHTVQSFGGFVASSSIDTNATGGNATFTVKVPSKNLNQTIAALSKLAHVANLSQSTLDITGAFTSVDQRLSDARQERKALLDALGKATTSQQVDALQARLRDNRRLQSDLQAQLRTLRRRADLASLNVEVNGDRKAHHGGGGGGGGSWTPGDAAGDALRVLQVALGVLLIAAAVALPIAVLAALAWLTARSARRRRREAALDGV